MTNENLGESCVTLSNYEAGYPTVHGVEIRGNRIHGCGKVVDGSHDHGIYVANAFGPVVTDNVIEDVHGGWGIQLWTTSINGVFERNVIRASPTATQGGVVIVAGSGSVGNSFRDTSRTAPPCSRIRHLTAAATARSIRSRTVAPRSQSPRPACLRSRGADA